LDFTIRKACEKDIPRIIVLLKQVAQIHNDSRPDLFKAGSKKYNENDLTALLCNDKVTVFIASDEYDTALGYIFCFMQEYKDHVIMQDIKTLYIDDLCIDENIRGSGIGKALYTHACNYAEKQGCYNITLNVWSGNDNALSFYEKLGMIEQKRTLEMIL